MITTPAKLHYDLGETLIRNENSQSHNHYQIPVDREYITIILTAAGWTTHDSGWAPPGGSAHHTRSMQMAFRVYLASLAVANAA